MSVDVVVRVHGSAADLWPDNVDLHFLVIDGKPTFSAYGKAVDQLLLAAIAVKLGVKFEHVEDLVARAAAAGSPAVSS